MDVSASQDKTKSTTTTRSRLYRYILLGGILLILAWLGFKGWRLARLAQSLQTHQAEAETLLANGMTSVDPDEAEALVMGLREDVVALQREVGLFLPLAPYFGWLPRVGPIMEDAPHLMEMADAGTEAAAYAVRGLKPALAVFQAEDSGTALIPQLLPILENARPDLLAASAAMEQVVVARAAIENPEALPWRVRSLLEKMDGRLQLASDSLKLAPTLPALLGHDTPRTYLIIAQNQDELRASGGFLTGAGVLTVDNGDIMSLAFQDANLVDEWWNKAYDFPPDPLYEYMGLELFLFRDANFWPDFPTTAEQAIDLYSYSQEVPPPDGAIAIDQQFVAELLKVTGPVRIPELETTVSAENAIASLRDAWGIGEGEDLEEWVPNRKDFLGPFAEAVKDRLFNNLGSVDPVFLADTLYRTVQEKHLQIYVRDPAGAAVLDEIDWDGGLDRVDEQDLLMVVDTNVGYNKVNPYVDSRLTYDVTLDETGQGLADLNVHYAHTGEKTQSQCQQAMPYDEAANAYEVLTRGCYWNYLRVYAPAGSNLVEATSHDVPAAGVLSGRTGPGRAVTVEDPTGLAVFGNYLLLPQGEELDSHYRYELPDVTATEDGHQVYTLTVYKQAGVGPQPLTVTVTLPAGAQFLSAGPTPGTVDGQTITFDTTLTTDHTFTITYE